MKDQKKRIKEKNKIDFDFLAFCPNVMQEVLFVTMSLFKKLYETKLS